jgi:type I restriction enzyme S subunit
MAETLEKIAQSVFRSWFIDFDPVKAKMAGETPVGMDDATAALFPDATEESELGPIPANWSIAPLTDFFDVLSGGTPRTTEKSYWDGPIPWFSVVDAPESGGCFFIKTEKTITELGISRSAAKVVRPGVTIISARGTVGKTAIVATPSTFNQSCYGLMGKCGDFFTFLLVKYMVAKLQNIAHGGMFDTITRDTFSALSFPKPTETVTQVFEKAVEPMFREIMNLQYQSEQISMIRDSLLPRLISGELQIHEETLVS